MDTNGWTFEIETSDLEDGDDLRILDADGFPIVVIEGNPILANWDERYPEMPHWSRGAADGRTQRTRSAEEVASLARMMMAARAMGEALRKLSDRFSTRVSDDLNRYPEYAEALAALRAAGL